VLHGATKFNIQEIYVTRVSVCNLATLYWAQSSFQRGEGRKKVSPLQWSIFTQQTSFTKYCICH